MTKGSAGAARAAQGSASSLATAMATETASAAAMAGVLAVANAPAPVLPTTRKPLSLKRKAVPSVSFERVYVRRPPPADPALDRTREVLELWFDDQARWGVGGFDQRSHAACSGLAIALGREGHSLLARYVRQIPEWLAKANDCDHTLGWLCGLALYVRDLRTADVVFRGRNVSMFGLLERAPKDVEFEGRVATALERALIVGFARSPMDFAEPRSASAWFAAFAPVIARRLRPRR